MMRRCVSAAGSLVADAPGVLGIATCDKGLPAMMMALAGLHDLPGVMVPGGVTLPPTKGKMRARCKRSGRALPHGLISLAEAGGIGLPRVRLAGRRLSISWHGGDFAGGGEALGISLPHSRAGAFGPAGLAGYGTTFGSRACMNSKRRKLTMRDMLTDAAFENAMVVHAAFGGSTNLLLHIPAIAHAAGLKRPTVEDWIAINRRVPRLVERCRTARCIIPPCSVFLAGGVPEVMLHLRAVEFAARPSALTVTGKTLGEILDWWETSRAAERFPRIVAGDRMAWIRMNVILVRRTRHARRV